MEFLIRNSSYRPPSEELLMNELLIWSSSSGAPSEPHQELLIRSSSMELLIRSSAYRAHMELLIRSSSYRAPDEELLIQSS